VQNKATGRVLAMKKFKKRFVDTSFEEVQNLREIQALKRLNPHPNIIQMVQVI
jgi:renal tumor antigen